jgi:hypothetical protein
MEAFDLATPGVFASARVDPDEADDISGLKCEIKTFEAQYNSAGEQITL